MGNRFNALLLLLVAPAVLPAQTPAGDEFVPLPTPQVRIGAEGDPDYEFAAVVAVIRLPNGHFAIGDWQRPSIRVFDDRGRLIQTIGRNGEGPGEFRSVTKLFLAADTLIAYDWQLRRLSWFSLAGKFLRSALLQPGPGAGPVDLTGRLAAGRWLVTTPHMPNWDHGPGTYRDTLGVGTLAATATGPVQWLGSYSGMTFYAHMPGQDKTRWSVGPILVAANTLAYPMGDSVIVGDNSQTTLDILDPAGVVRRRVVLPLPPGGDARHLRQALKQKALNEARDARSREYVEAAYEATRQDPRYENFMVANDGTLWVRLLREGTGAPIRYLVLTRSGRVHARVRIGPRSRILAVGRTEIVVIATDTNDVEQVEVIPWTSTN